VRLNDGKRQKNQLQPLLAFPESGRSEAPEDSRRGTESPLAKHRTESPASTEQLMEEICERENCKQALARVKANKGSPGIDGMTVEKLPDYLTQHWPEIREQLRSGTYKPQPVKRVEIPKPDGGIRKLGIPTTLDRLIQQMVLQVLQRSWDPTFSEHSYGFRPGRSAHHAVAQAGDGKHYSVSHHEAQTQSKSGEECGGSAEGQEVPRIQLHGRQATATAHCTESDLAVQGANPGADVPDPRNQHGAESQGTL